MNLVKLSFEMRNKLTTKKLVYKQVINPVYKQVINPILHELKYKDYYITDRVQRRVFTQVLENIDEKFSLTLKKQIQDDIIANNNK
jgi:hypothetical protein